MKLKSRNLYKKVKVENVGYQKMLISLSQNVSKTFSFRVIKTWDCVIKGYFFTTQSWLSETLRKSTFDTLQQKQEMIETSIFSFSHNVFHPVKMKNHNSLRIHFFIFKFFQFEQG